ncbi:MAG: DUF1492 domain-containing protein [Oscillospiraceae bacterium]|nr:DUF1492 domain-containing protein [Oscillospiraceae bacterium]
MTAKQHLRQVRDVDVSIDAKLEQIMRLRVRAENLRSLSSAGGNTHTRDKMGECLEKIEELESKINEDINRQIDLKADIYDKIRELENTDYKTLLELKYLNFETWEKVAEKMNRSVSGVHVLHAKALRKINV